MNDVEAVLKGERDWAVVVGDSLTVLPTLAAGSFDAVVTDPPYNIGTPQRITDVRAADKRLVGGDFGVFDEGAVKPSEWMPLCRRLLNPGGALLSFYGSRSMGELLSADAGFEVIQDFHWCKSNPPCPMRGVGFSWGVESGYAFRRKGERHRYNKAAGMSPNWVVVPICGGDERTPHPTQKPEAVMAWLVKHWTFPGDLVLDQFGGAGTTAVACVRAGRRCIAVEKRPDYAALARERLEAGTVGGPLFAAPQPTLFGDAP